tara:strand:- start:459 stop:710 length:252 start_codon:yes stop_codon:yes gene_type:complete
MSPQQQLRVILIEIARCPLVYTDPDGDGDAGYLVCAPVHLAIVLVREAVSVSAISSHISVILPAAGRYATGCKDINNIIKAVG